MAIPFRRGLITVDEFQRMAETGVFTRDVRLELIRGEIVEMTPIGDPHALCVMLIGDAFADLRPAGIVSPQNPLRLPGQQSVPQPDIVLLRRRPDFRARPPQVGDVLLLVEVSDSSLAYDRDVKIPLYAESGIPEAWLVDLHSKTIFVYRRPSAEGYQEVRQYRRGDAISIQTFPDVQFSMEEILG
jgi:Uma2 family endonuclease